MASSRWLMEKRELFSGNWLRLVELERECSDGARRKWESVERVGSRGAAAMLAVLRPSGRVVLVRQFRPPAERFVIELPAGLIDEGETAGETAVRELREETGYHGRIERVWPAAFSSPGLSGETITIVEMSIDENAPENDVLETDFDEGEDLETFLVPKGELRKFLLERVEAGDGVDAKLLSLAVDLER